MLQETRFMGCGAKREWKQLSVQGRLTTCSCFSNAGGNVPKVSVQLVVWHGTLVLRGLRLLPHSHMD